jgi:hypothetical protein
MLRAAPDEGLGKAVTDWKIQRTDAVALRIRLGLNSCRVVVRSIGSDLHMDYRRSV